MNEITQKQADIMRMNTAELLIESVTSNLFRVAMQLCIEREFIPSPIYDGEFTRFGNYDGAKIERQKSASRGFTV